MSGHPGGFPSPNHQGNFPNQMQMRNQMAGGGPMVPMMNMSNMGMQNQMVMMNSPICYNQGGMMMPQQPPQQSPQQTLPSPGCSTLGTPAMQSPAHSNQHHQMQLQHQQMHQQQQQQQQAQQESALKGAASIPNTFGRMPNTMPRMSNTFSNVPSTFGGGAVTPDEDVQMRDDGPGASAKQFPGMSKQPFPGPPKPPTVAELPKPVGPHFSSDRKPNGRQESVLLPAPPIKTDPDGAAAVKPPLPNANALSAAAAAAQPHPNQQKEFNIVSLCRYGQETVQDILSRFQEVFGALKSVQPPNTNLQATAATATTEKKVTEQFRTIRLLFKRLRLLFDKCNDSCQLGMDYSNIEHLIPLKDGVDVKPDPTQSEEYRKHLQENRELTEAITLKNKQLREIIDRIRIIIWEINTMLSMRRS